MLTISLTLQNNHNIDVFRLTTFIPMIIGEIRRYLRDNNSIRVSRSLRDTAYKALQVKERLINAKGAEPTIEEIAKELEIPKEDVLFALDAIQDPISLFEPVYNDGGDAIYVMDQVKDNKNTDVSWIENLSLSEAMKRLSDREKHILNLRFFEGKTQMEVADEIGITYSEKLFLFERRKDAYKGGYCTEFETEVQVSI